MKTLIVYYSHGGNNELLAYRLQKELGCDVIEVEPAGKRTGFSVFLDIMFARTPRIKPCTIALDQYDLFIFAAPIWSGKVAAPLKSFLIREREHIKDYAFVTLCGGGMTKQQARVRDELTSIIGREPVATKELWTLELPRLTRESSSKMVSGYRVTPEDLNYFRHDILSFINDLPVELAHH